MSSTPALEPYLQHLRLTPASSSSSTRSMARASSSPSPNPNSVIRRVAVAAAAGASNSVLGAPPQPQPVDRTYINVQPAAVASRHSAVKRNPGSRTQWPVNRMMNAAAAGGGTRNTRSASAEASGNIQVIFLNQQVANS